MRILPWLLGWILKYFENLSHHIDQFFSRWSFTFDHLDKKKISLQKSRWISCFFTGKVRASLLHVEISNFEPLFHNENLAKFFSTVKNEKSNVKVTANFLFSRVKFRSFSHVEILIFYRFYPGNKWIFYSASSWLILTG